MNRNVSQCRLGLNRIGTFFLPPHVHGVCGALGCIDILSMPWQIELPVGPNEAVQIPIPCPVPTIPEENSWPAKSPHNEPNENPFEINPNVDFEVFQYQKK